MHDKIYLSCHYYVIHITNHCMPKYIRVVIIMLYILKIIASQNIFELSLLCYTCYKSLHGKIYLNSSLLCYTYYKPLHDKIYLSCQYYVIHTTNHCMTKYIWVVIILLYIIQIIAWQNIFELALLCYTYYQIIAWQNIFRVVNYYVIHTTNHCITNYISVAIIILYILQIIA